MDLARRPVTQTGNQALWTSAKMAVLPVIPTREPKSCKVASPSTVLPFCYSIVILPHYEIFYMQLPFSRGCCEVRRLFAWYLHFKEKWGWPFL
jgi:hypothetical protein